MINFRSGGSQLPPVVKNILIINVLVFLADNLLARAVNLSDILALHYWGSPLFRWWQLFTHMFMHGSIAHIFFNMFALWMFGSVLENIWGPKRFLMFYLICGLGAAFCHLAVLGFQFHRYYEAFQVYQNDPGLTQFVHFAKKFHIDVNQQVIREWSDNPTSHEYISSSIKALNDRYIVMTNEATVGASGAIFGLLFAFGYLFPNTELMLLFPPIPIKAKWFVAGYALIELYLGIQNSVRDNVAHFAHLGGMLFAFILLRIWKSRIRDRFY